MSFFASLDWLLVAAGALQPPSQETFQKQSYHKESGEIGCELSCGACRPTSWKYWQECRTSTTTVEPRVEPVHRRVEPVEPGVLKEK